MTIRIPEESFSDRILGLLGKKRAVRIPTEVYEKYVPHAYAVMKKEPFLKALFRGKSAELPEGWVYFEYLPSDKTD